ncbi:hypothetical protein AVEN_48672-1 [Araneus ventricosus]|uniref:Uncharacterized protein n=1 Tax=Araneus ventricosus TaxID=182803 RepID=A0A4Y2QFK3_ARAVE|nr:hypothetical protein AVEN_138202-1 [Araneus ventricosus]GBN62313.1 hypothetical protein AVEN_267052-1 [Araneus ventricosus]GBN63885.1 hypothetical protein AVEN_48672-1 [Araneus ventricosus]
MAGRHDFIGKNGPRIIAPIKSGSCDDPPFYRGTTRHRRWAVRVTPPLLFPPGKREPSYLSGGFSSLNSLCPHRGSEDPLTYPAASPP